MYHLKPRVVRASIHSAVRRRKISWSLEAARFRFKLFKSLWNLTGTSATALPRCLSNVKAIHNPISRIRDFTRFGSKRSYRVANKRPRVPTVSSPVARQVFKTVVSVYMKIFMYNLSKRKLSCQAHFPNGLCDYIYVIFGIKSPYLSHATGFESMTAISHITVA